MDCSSYRDVLQEYLTSSSEYTTKIRECVNYSEDHIIYTTIRTFCESKSSCKRRKRKVFVVSLSGGVDSMVILSVIHHLGFDAVAIHLNYNNRPETSKEQAFLEEWCGYNKIPMYTQNITKLIRGKNVKRSDYEERTKAIRFNLYKEVLQKKEYEHADSIILGHHKDDVVENILTNLCRARSLLNLAVLKEETVIEGVHITRPLVHLFKNDVYDFAHKNRVPYFKDTTPTWSVRGILRNHIMPALHMAFKHNSIKENLLKVNEQTAEWNELIQVAVMEPFFQECVFHEEKVTIPINDVNRKYPFCFWNMVFMKIFYRYQYNCPSNKSIMMFMNFINTRKNGKFSLSNKCSCFLEDEKQYNYNFYDKKIFSISWFYC